MRIYIALFLMLMCSSGLLLSQDLIFEDTREVYFSVSVVADGLSVIWDIEPLPDGRIFVLQRSGLVHLIDNEGSFISEPYYQFPSLYAQGQGGLLDMTTDPLFTENGYLYVTYTRGVQGEVVTRLSRFTDTGTSWEGEVVLYDANPSGRTKHFGSRVIIGNDGKLYMTLGERGELDKAQNLDTLHGKILRLNRDGSIPVDNPFRNTADALTEIYSFGHRNPQGMDIHPLTGRIYISEHGPSGYDRPGGGDEINLLSPGTNYGWPIIHHAQRRRNMQHPIIQFTPATAPGGALFYDGSMFPEWRNSFLVPNLRGQSLSKIDLDGDDLIDHEFLLEGQFGRLRAIAVDTDGSILLGTSNGDLTSAKVDKILRLTRNK